MVYIFKKNLLITICNFIDKKKIKVKVNEKYTPEITSSNLMRNKSRGNYKMSVNLYHSNQHNLNTANNTAELKVKPLES